MSSTDQLGTNAPPIRIDSSMVSAMAGNLTANTAQPINPLMGHLMHQSLNQTLHPAIHQVQRHPHIMPNRPMINQSVSQPTAPVSNHQNQTSHQTHQTHQNQQTHQAHQTHQNPTPSRSTSQPAQSTNQSSHQSHNHSVHDDHDDHDDSDVDDSDDEGSDAPNQSINQSNKGGSSCHQCKSRRNYNALTYCTATLDAKSKKCRKKFCGHCLRKFYKENPSLIPSKSSWICPSCRKICCCAACRRRKQRESGSTGPDEGEMKKRTKTSHSYTAPSSADQSTGPAYDSSSTSQSVNQSVNVPPSTSTDQSAGADAPSMSDDEDNSLGHIPQNVSMDVFNSMLSSHITCLAEENMNDHGETQFSVLYKAAKQGKTRKRIKHILQQADLTSEKKVELIALSLVNVV